MDALEIKKWIETFPVSQNDANTWKLNKKILKAIAARHSDGLSFAFGTDISIRYDSFWPKDMVRTKKALEKALKAYAKGGGDVEWAERTRKELDILPAPYFGMLEMHGLQSPDGKWVMEGTLSDVLEYRYGQQLHGVGWHDEPYNLEVRTKPLEPLEFIAAYHRIMHTLEERKAKPGHVHLHVSAWKDGKPFQGGRNIFEMATPEDLQETKGALAALSYSWGNRAGVSPLRGYQVPIRSARGRAEIRALQYNPKELHMAKEMLETMCSVRYGIKNPSAPHLPQMHEAWRPVFSVPGNPYLQLELNQARFADGVLEPKDNLFKLADIGGEQKDGTGFFRKEKNYPPLYVTIGVVVKEGKPVVSVRAEKGMESIVPEKARAELEVLLNQSVKLVTPTISTAGTADLFAVPKFERFEGNPAYKLMPADVFSGIGNSYRHDEDLPPKKQGRGKG